MEAAARTMDKLDTSVSNLRTGDEFLRDLRSSRRTIFVEGEKVSDPTQHPAFSEAARTIAGLFDFAAAPQNRELMTYISPDTNRPVWRCYQIARTHADL